MDGGVVKLAFLFAFVSPDNVLNYFHPSLIQYITASALSNLFDFSILCGRLFEIKSGSIDLALRQSRQGTVPLRDEV